MPICDGCSTTLSEQCRLNCLSRFDGLSVSEPRLSFPLIAPRDVAILPLLDTWHIFRSFAGMTSSYVVDDWAMAMLSGVWAGKTAPAIAAEIARNSGAARARIQTDLEEVLVSLKGIVDGRQIIALTSKGTVGQS